MFLCSFKGSLIWFVSIAGSGSLNVANCAVFLNCSNNTWLSVCLVELHWKMFFLLFVVFFWVNSPPVPEAQEVFGGSCPCEAVSWGIFCLMDSQEATMHTWVGTCLGCWLGCFVDQLLLRLHTAAYPFTEIPAQDYRGQIWSLGSSECFLPERWRTDS